MNQDENQVLQERGLLILSMFGIALVLWGIIAALWIETFHPDLEIPTISLLAACLTVGVSSIIAGVVR